MKRNYLIMKEKQADRGDVNSEKEENSMQRCAADPKTWWLQSGERRRVLTGARCLVTSEDLRRAKTDTQRHIGVTAGTTQKDLDGQRGSGMDRLRCD